MDVENWIWVFPLVSYSLTLPLFGAARPISSLELDLHTVLMRHRTLSALARAADQTQSVSVQFTLCASKKAGQVFSSMSHSRSTGTGLLMVSLCCNTGLGKKTWTWTV